MNTTSEHRYELYVDGVLAGYSDYSLSPGRITFRHTQLLEEFEGRGFAGVLARFALDDARSTGQAVAADCPYITGFLARHPGYQDLINPAP